MKQQTYTNNKPTLYLVATPIGNLEEMTYRSINILKSVKLIACEDTRNTKILTNHYGINTPLLSYHEHNERMMCEKIISVLKEGNDVALVSDAGYPLISDPGSILVDEVLKNDFNVTTISGPCAFLNALVASNMNLSSFTFIGFLDPKSSARKKQLSNLIEKKETLIFYESVHRIEDTLKDFLEILGNRKITLARELTKKFEEYTRGTIQDVLDSINENTKGEFVIIVEGNKEDKITDENLLLKEINELIKNGQKSKSAAEIVANKYSLKKNYLYELYIKNKK
jgi:16S rRNA (cytidine1402-2'-O)-methyltransferase